MPSWKPDCLRSSATFNQLSHTINSAKFLHGDNHLANSSKSSLRDDNHKNNQSTLNKSDLTNSSKALSFQNASQSAKSSIQKAYSVVELIRSNNSQFGLTIAGGTDKDSRPRICDLKPGSIAHRSDELQIGDMIISINGIKTMGLKHEEIIDLIKNAGDSLCLEFEYNLPPWPIHPHHAVRSQNVHIQLEKENLSYGFTLRGGFNEEKIKSRPLIVTNIRSGGSADREGTLKIGDRIIAINGINVLNATLQDTYNIIKQCKGMTLFLVEYDSAIVDSIKNSNGPLLIEIEKSPGSSIGIKLMLNKINQGKNQILVESVKPASIADRCGAIYVGDQILSIDDVSFEHVTLAEANQILKNCVGEFSRVEILPLSQMLLNGNNGSVKYQKQNITDIYENGSTKSNSSTFTVNSSSSGTSLANNFQILQAQHSQIQQLSGLTHGNLMNNFNSSDSLANLGQLQSQFNQNLNDLTLQTLQKIMHRNQSRVIGSKNQNGNRTFRKSSRDRKNSISSINSCSTSLTSNQVSHSEIVDFFLKSDDNGTFGFTLQGAGVVMTAGNHSNDTIQNIIPYPVVGYVEPNSSAERCGLMQPGDRIISVNQRSLEGLSVEEARQIIKEAGSNLKLEIQFDVADTIMLTSGVFQVKLLKKNLDIGITVQYPRHWKAENYPYIHDLKKGSVAYRNGMLQRGDTILFIDNISLRNKNMNEINQLLRSPDEVIKLKIRKEETYAVEDPEEKIVVYTVEMQRNGGPLGITISGSDDLFEPMFVSGLTENGLAERTNAIHVGDIILAINNVSLRGKSLTEAIELLQNADDMVTLKISRKLEKVNQMRLNDSGYGQKNSQNTQFIPNGYKLANNNQLIADKDQFNESFMNKSSPYFLNENGNGSIHSGSVNGQQYLPFPMDMTSFIKSNNGIKSAIMNSNGHINNNVEASPKNIQKLNENSHKYTNASLDSINAVERELDEVLKDLELNSQDLTDQLNENVYHTNSITGSIELPINIQKSHSSNNRWPNVHSDINNNSYVKKAVNMPGSEFINLAQNDIFINENYDLKNQTTSTPSRSTGNNNNMKRQNIISTYENSGLIQPNADHVTSYQHQNIGVQQANMILPKKSAPSNNNVSSDFKNFNNSNRQVNSHNGHQNSINQFVMAPQQQDQTYASNRSIRTVLSQISEVNENNSSSSLNNVTAKLTTPIIKSKTGEKSNGGVISQKVITIGLPNQKFAENRSSSPNMISSQSIPITKVTSGLKIIAPKAEEEKLDKLPPLAPSSGWSNRRGQVGYSSGRSQQRRPNSKTSSGSGQSTDGYEQNLDGSSENDRLSIDRNLARQNFYLNNNSSNNGSDNNELNIQEQGTTSSYEEESSNSSTKTSGTIKSSENNSNNDNKLNYDNFNVVEGKSDSNEEPEEKINLTISKDPRFSDFGFSISDNFLGPGILVNKIRNGSPADENQNLKPFTQIYKINSIDCTKLDCAQVSSILANEKSNVMHLVVSSNPKRLSLSNDATLSERKANLQNAYAISSSRATAL